MQEWIPCKWHVSTVSGYPVAMKLGPSQVFAPSHKESQQDIQSITCGSCGHSISASPYIRKNLRGYFSGILEVKKQPSRARSNTRIRIEGEVITSDEFLQYLDRELENRAQRKKKTADLETATAVDLPQSESEGQILQILLLHSSIFM